MHTMMENQNIFIQPKKPPTHKRTVLIILISIGGLLVIAASTALVLYLLAPPQLSQSPTLQTDQKALAEIAASPDELVTTYAKTIPTRYESLYTKREIQVDNSPVKEEKQYKGSVAASQGPTNSVITYKGQKTFSIQVSAADYVQYLRKDGETGNDNQFISDTEKFLDEQKLVKSETTQISDDVVNIIYDSKNIVCQISDVSATDQHPATYGLACINKQLVNERYTMVESLLEIANDIDTSAIESVVASSTISQDTMRLIMLTVIENDKAKVLYFAATDGDNWEYIGQRTVTTPDDEASFTLSPELLDAINAPKWGDFLKNYIQ